MRWSFRLMTIAGTALHVHVTFLLLLAFVGYAGWTQGGAPAAVDGVIFILAVFACVVLHEFGHVAAARRYGIATPEITLLPIGGVANLERMPERPRQELVVAIAGPAVNVVIAGVLMLVLGARFDPADLDDLQALQTSLAARLLAVNIMLVAFNLIPAFPLDGGRMLRAVLAMRMDRVRATRLAARTGQAFAILFALVGLMGNPFLLLIAIFIFFAAETETSHEAMQAGVAGRTAREAMVSRFQSLGPDSTADDARRLLLETTQQEFPVVDDGRLAGMVTRRGLIDAMAGTGAETPVTDFMVRNIDSVAPGMPLSDVMPKLAASPARAVAILDGEGRFKGYVSADNAAELIMVDEALRQGTPPARQGNMTRGSLIDPPAARSR